jgi:hypothetical protein
MLHNIVVFFDTLAFVYLCFLAGNLFFRFIKIDFTSRYKRVIYPIMIGYGIFGIIGLFLGITGWFNASILRLFSILILIFSADAIKDHFHFLKRNASPKVFFTYLRQLYATNTGLKLIITAWLLANFLIVFMPITGHDTLDYHLPIIFNLLNEGKLTFSNNIPSYTYLPVFGEIVYAIPMVIFGNLNEPFVFQVLQYGVLLLFLGLIYDFLRSRMESQFLNLISLLLTLSIMDFQRELLHGGYIDVFAFLFGIASLLLIIESCGGEETSKDNLTLSAFFLGIALSIKFFALIFTAINLLFLILTMYRRVKIGEAIAFLSKYIGIAFAISGFWYIKNAFVFGNPVFPMFSDTEFNSSVGMFLMDRTLLNFFLFPFYRYGQWFIQEVESSSRLVVLGYFIMLYLITLVIAFIDRKKINLTDIILFAAIHLYLAALFLTSHQYRFLLPVVILLPIFLTLMTDKLYSYLSSILKKDTYQRLLKSSLIVFNIIFIFIFLANIRYFYAKWYYFIGTYTRDEYVEEIGGQ